MSELSAEFVAAQRARLEAQLTELSARARTAMLLVRDREHEVGDLVDTSGEDQEAIDAVQESPREIELLHDVRASLARLARGEYDECEECGDAIGARRLEARPSATRCVACQEEHERSVRALRVRPGLLDEYM